MQDNHYTPAMILVVSAVWLLNLLALSALSRRRPYSMLDLWLIVTMCAWLFDIALSAVLNAGRYDLGFYAGRIYGLLAASFVLIVLLHEHGKLYVQLIKLRDSDREKAAELHRLSTIDPLTGIANRRAFEDALDQEWRRMMRHGSTLSLLMIDVDCFKRFNDAYGHVAGDQCLRVVAQVLAGKARRAGEMAARYGGEEFAVLLPHVDIAEARKLGEAICAAVRDRRIPHEHSDARALCHHQRRSGQHRRSAGIGRHLVSRGHVTVGYDARGDRAGRDCGPCALSRQEVRPQSGGRGGR